MTGPTTAREALQKVATLNRYGIPVVDVGTALETLAPFLIPEGCVAVCRFCMREPSHPWATSCNKEPCPLKPKDTP